MKNTIILILSLLVIGLGSYVIFDKVISKDKAENSVIEATTNCNSSQQSTQNAVECEFKIDSKYVGTYVGEKGKDEIVIKGDGTYSFKRISSIETRGSGGLAVTNGVFLALVEMYDTYDENNFATPDPVTYYFVVSGNTLKSLNSSASESIVFTKK